MVRRYALDSVLSSPDRSAWVRALPTARAALARVLIDGAPADKAVKRALRGADLDNEARAALSRWVFGGALFQKRLRHLLDDDDAPVDELLLAYLVDQLSWSLDEAAALFGDGEASPVLAARAHATVWPTAPAARLAVERSLPERFARALVGRLGAEADALLAVLNQPGPVTLRTNTLTTTRAALLEALGKAGTSARAHPFVDDAVVVESRMNVHGSDLWRAGCFEVQDAGSQLIARAVAAQPGEQGVDFCTGFGGKSLALAAAMKNQGALLALDVDAAKLKAQAGRLARAGVDIVETRALSADGAVPGGVEAGAFDFVLVDAPCSAVGGWRRGPDLRWRITDADLDTFPVTQRAILERAAQLVKVGGRLVYATCTLLLDENEAVTDAFTTAHANASSTMRFLPDGLADALGPAWSAVAPPGGDAPLVTLWPHRTGTDGFFIARWTRVT